MCSHAATIVDTGGKLTLKYIKKTTRGPHCGDCKISLPGVRCGLLWSMLSLAPLSSTDPLDPMAACLG